MALLDFVRDYLRERAPGR